MSKKIHPLLLPVILFVLSQKTAGKTVLSTLLADLLALNRAQFLAFQTDDQRRLSHLIGNVVDLRPDPGLVAADGTLLMRALTPLHTAGIKAATERTSILVDGGAHEVESFTNFLRDVGFAEDAAQWKLPIVTFVPFLPLDSESSRSAAFTVERMTEVVPGARIVLVENRFGGDPTRIVAGSPADEEHQKLLRATKGMTRIVMPEIPREYWAPWEGAGIRFLKALAMDPTEASQVLHRSVAEVKISKSALARFWRTMHQQLSEIVELPEGGR
jgi:hypothetical protein